MKAFICDSFHVNERNFSALYSVISKFDSVSVGLDREHLLFNLTRAYGNYHQFVHPRALNSTGVFTAIPSFYYRLRDLDRNELFTFDFHKINVFSVCHHELLARLLPSEDWYESDVANDYFAVFSKADSENREVLLQNMAAAWFWLSYWKENIKEISAHDCAFVFSGGLIYSRSFLEICKRTRAKAYVLESLFTGNQFVCEERYTPVANRSIISSKNYRAQLKARLEKQGIDFNRETVKAFNSLKNMKNKNAVQPERKPIPKFRSNGNIVVVAGQVVNDFSIINSDVKYLSTITTYKKAIWSILKYTKLNVVFKGHPWENKKDNVKRPVTLEGLYLWRAHLPSEWQDRLLLLQDQNISMLFEVCTHFVTICSQSGLEAAAAGLKPVTLGPAFYGGMSFVDRCDDPEKLGCFLDVRETGTLSPAEYRAYEEFLTLLLQEHAISNTPQGARALLELLTQIKPIPWAKQEGVTEVDIGQLFSEEAHQFRAQRSSEKADFDKHTADYVQIKPPSEVSCRPGVELWIDVVIQNHNDFVIEALPQGSSAGEKIHISYHVFKDKELVEYDGMRTEIRGVIRNSYRQGMKIKSPAEAGRYDVHIDLVYEHVLWFGIECSMSLLVEDQDEG